MFTPFQPSKIRSGRNLRWLEKISTVKRHECRSRPVLFNQPWYARRVSRNRVDRPYRFQLLWLVLRSDDSGKTTRLEQRCWHSPWRNYRGISMPIMPGITVEATRHHGGGFHRPNPIGIVCHRTECSFDRARSGFVRGPKSVHFLIVKVPGNAAQLIDTSVVAYHVGPGANALFVGIEFESVAARPGYEHRTDPLVNGDPLTAYQLDMG